MKQPIIQAWDDLDLSVRGVKVEATEERRLELNGHAVTLDLTAEHAKNLDDVLAPYLAAGTTVKAPSNKKPRADADGTRREKMAALREWADSEGRTREYKTPGGSYYYPPKLIAAYDAYLASQGK